MYHIQFIIFTKKTLFKMSILANSIWNYENINNSSLKTCNSPNQFKLASAISTIVANFSAQWTCLSWCVYPCKMAEMRIGGHANHCSVYRLKILNPIAEGYDLSRANKGAVMKFRKKWIKLISEGVCGHNICISKTMSHRQLKVDQWSFCSKMNFNSICPSKHKPYVQYLKCAIFNSVSVYSSQKVDMNTTLYKRGRSIERQMKLALYAFIEF